MNPEQLCSKVAAVSRLAQGSPYFASEAKDIRSKRCICPPGCLLESGVGSRCGIQAVGLLPSSVVPHLCYKGGEVELELDERSPV